MLCSFFLNKSLNRAVWLVPVITLCAFSMYSKGQPLSAYLDSVENVVRTAALDTVKANACIVMATQLRGSDPDKALRYAEKALAFSKKSEFRNGMIKAHDLAAYCHYVKGNYPAAIGNWDKTLEMRRLDDDRQGMAASYIWLGIAGLAQSDYVKALDYQQQAERILDSLNNRAWLNYVYNNIGAVYRGLGEFSKAREYFMKAMYIDQEMADTANIALDLDNIGVVYKDEGEFHLALEYYFKALRIKERNGDQPGMGITLGNIGALYAELAGRHKDDTQKADSLHNIAFSHFFRSMELRRASGATSMVATMMSNIGTLYYETKVYDKAESYLAGALSLSDSIGALAHVQYCHEQLAELYYSAGRYDAACAHYREFSRVKDEIFSDEKSKSLGKLEARHEYTMEEMKTKREEAEASRIIREQAARRNSLQYSGISILLILLATTLLFGTRTIGLSDAKDNSSRRLIKGWVLPVRVVEGLVFLTFLLFFEFTLVLLDPLIEQYSAGAPAIKLLINGVLAALIFPLHSFFEEKLKRG